MEAALSKFRERAAVIAGEISRDWPGLTVHDVSHLDGLWDMASLLAGPEYPLTPTEAFILGGAFLVHDLGLGLAAYPEGEEEFKSSTAWTDAVVALYLRRLGRRPQPDEIHEPAAELKREVIEQVLRLHHAERAARLPQVAWGDKENPFYLIEDTELRTRFGGLIGRLGASHWWPVSDLLPAFRERLGAPPGVPASWTVEPLKLACFVRTADAAHLHPDRAPAFLRAVRRPPRISEDHWAFQEKLQQPMLEGDRLVYTAAQPFLQEEANAWWLCFDSLQMVDRELADVDDLLSDQGLPRLSARGVSGAADPGRLARLVRTDGWLPVDATVRIGDPAALIRVLGGEELYGPQSAHIVLRELVQNSSDAVRARRLRESRPDVWGAITVSLAEGPAGYVLEVADNGIGMSQTAITDHLLNFGSSYWSSGLMQQELPGLLTKGFEATGKYGIGFYSVFMIGSRVQVFTRGIDDARRDTRVLEFPEGLSGRPLLRTATEPEALADAGTLVRVSLDEPPRNAGRLLAGKVRFAAGGIWFDSGVESLGDLCRHLCPALDVSLSVREGDAEEQIVKAGDWTTMAGQELASRLGVRRFRGKEPAYDHLRLIREGGAVVGRIAIWPDSDGIVAVGGLLGCEMSGIAGVLVGDPVRVARDRAIPRLAPGTLASWATEEANTLSRSDSVGSSVKRAAVALVLRCGGDPGVLPFGRAGRELLPFSQIGAWAQTRDEVLLIDDGDLQAIVETLLKEAGHGSQDDRNWEALRYVEVAWELPSSFPSGFETMAVQESEMEFSRVDWPSSATLWLPANLFIIPNAPEPIIGVPGSPAWRGAAIWPDSEDVGKNPGAAAVLQVQEV